MKNVMTHCVRSIIIIALKNKLFKTEHISETKKAVHLKFFVQIGANQNKNNDISQNQTGNSNFKMTSKAIRQ